MAAPGLAPAVQGAPVSTPSTFGAAKASDDWQPAGAATSNSFLDPGRRNSNQYQRQGHIGLQTTVLLIARSDFYFLCKQPIKIKWKLRKTVQDDLDLEVNRKNLPGQAHETGSLTQETLSLFVLLGFSFSLAFLLVLLRQSCDRIRNGGH